MSGKYALIIGNTEYTDPGLAQLSAPGKDARDLSRVLTDREICAFDEVNTILNEPSSSVIEIIDEFFDQKKPDDLLVLYFSGHGIRDEFGSLYLAFKNTVRSRLRSTAIKSDYIREVMDQSRSKRQVLILDCCNSGAFPQGTKAEVGGAMGMVSALQGYGRLVLTASDATQFAWEGNKIIGETDNSLFTHFLVKGLKGEADSDGDGKITVDELYDYAYDQILRVTPKQTPTKSTSKQEGEIVLRQFTRVEDIKPAPLPTPLLDTMENPFADIRLGAVQELTKLLNGKNLGLARSAKEALQRIAEADDSNRVKWAAKQALESTSFLDSQLDQRHGSAQSIITKEQGELTNQKATNEPITQERKETKYKVNEAELKERTRTEAIKAARQKEQEERQLKLQQKTPITTVSNAKVQVRKTHQQPIPRNIFASVGIGALFMTCIAVSLILKRIYLLPAPLETATSIVISSSSPSLPTTEIYTPTLPTPVDTSTIPASETPTSTITFTPTYTNSPTFTPSNTWTPSITPTPTSQFQSYRGEWINPETSPTARDIDYALKRLVIKQADDTHVTFQACWVSNTNTNEFSLSPASITGSFNNNVLGGGSFDIPNRLKLDIKVRLSGPFSVIVTVVKSDPNRSLLLESEDFRLDKNTTAVAISVDSCFSPGNFSQ